MYRKIYIERYVVKKEIEGTIEGGEEIRGGSGEGGARPEAGGRGLAAKAGSSASPDEPAFAHSGNCRCPIWIVIHFSSVISSIE